MLLTEAPKSQVATTSREFEAKYLHDVADDIQTVAIAMGRRAKPAEHSLLVLPKKPYIRHRDQSKIRFESAEELASLERGLANLYRKCTSQYQVSLQRRTLKSDVADPGHQVLVVTFKRITR